MRHAVLMLPFPVSVNGLYANIKRGRIKTKRYKVWIEEADLMMMKQNLTYFHNRVDVVINLGGGRQDSDCDNFCKCILDRLVEYKIIHDDCKPYVRSVKSIWNDDVSNGAMIEIQEIENEEQG